MNLLTTTLFLCFVVYVQCWHSLGHMSVGKIGALRLAQLPEGDKALQWAISILEPLKDFCGEKDHPFSECATWPDKIKYQNWKSMSGWHFSDRRYVKPGYVAPDEVVTFESQNITWAISQAKTHLASASQDPYGHSKSVLGKSLAMRNLVHFVGDIHQPLHTTARISEKYPNGDMGGNMFKIKHYNPKLWKWNNLHFVWDHLFEMGGSHSSMQSPLTVAGNQFLTDFSQGIMTEHPFSELKDQIAKNNTPQLWDDEGYEIVTSFVYTGISEYQDLPQDYQDKAKTIIRKRLALAGYRLADMVLEIYQDLQASLAKLKKNEFIAN